MTSPDPFEEARKPRPPKLPKFLLDLGRDKAAIIDSMLFSNLSVDGIVKMVKEEWGLLQHVTPNSLRTALFKYKKRFILARQKDLVDVLTEPKKAAELNKAKLRTVGSINPVEKLEWVVDEQVLRIQKLMEQERKMPGLMDGVTKNIDLLGRLLGQVTDAHFKLGLLKKVPEKVDFGFEITSEEHRFMENMRMADTMASVTHRALALLRGDGVLVDGSFKRPLARDLEAQNLEEGDAGTEE